MNPTITAFGGSPDRGRGLARDMQVRWALEEVGQPYDVHAVPFGTQGECANRTRQPFGQIPSYDDGAVVLFESGSIVLHIAETNAGLLPKDANARARAITWMFAALSTIEPPLVAFTEAKIFEKDKPWYEARLPMVEKRLRDKLEALANTLGDADWLEGDFSAGDLMMIGVMRRLGSSGLLKDYPNLAAYVARGEARPAFKRAFDAQLAFFSATSGS
jgi:glutathione S-transferase